MESTAFESFIEYLQQYAGFLEEVAKSQNEKLEALLSHDVAVMERSVAQQQSIALQMENFEKGRAKHQEDAGFSGMSLQQIADAVGPESGRKILACHARMSDAVGQIKFLNDKAMHLVETNLQLMDMTVPPAQRREAQGYTERGEQVPAAEKSPIFQTKI